MSIDPLKTLEGLRTTAVGLVRGGRDETTGEPFEKLLKAAEAASLSARQLAEEATAMVKLARLQMVQGLFDAEVEPGRDDHLPHFALPQEISQNLDNLQEKWAAERFSLLRARQPGRGEIEGMIDQVAERVSLAPELIRSVVSAESDFTPDAVSHAGAEGLMQLMPETARELGVKDSFDPLQNLLGGSIYLKQLLSKYDGDLDHALAAYNWGQGNVDRHGLEKMPQETKAYLAKVKNGLGLS